MLSSYALTYVCERLQTEWTEAVMRQCTQKTHVRTLGGRIRNMSGIDDAPAGSSEYEAIKRSVSIASWFDLCQHVYHFIC